jgi:cation diffusion facilitator CzcD-associated flavoprotein CzcO
MTLPRSCIIGAGCSGFTTAKALQDAGLPFDCFEMSDVVGGNWVYKNRNGRSSCYQSLHIDTSKTRMQFADFPIPAEFPDYPHHSQIASYFDAYVDHFGLRAKITFNTEVKRAERDADGIWQVTLSTGETRAYDALFVCNGHHWDPHTPVFPGHFDGVAMHSHHYLSPFEPHDMRGKSVLVVGMGNSAMDIASELSQKPIAKKLFVAARRGVWIFPKYINGRPPDKGVAPPWLPKWFVRRMVKRLVLKAVGKMSDYGLPEPEHHPADAHPSVSGEFLTRVGCGDITVKPNIAELKGGRVRFADGTEEEIDAIVYATGYNVSFPFLGPETVEVVDNHVPLWKRMMKPGIPNLFFMGLAQPLPTLVNFAEVQAKFAAKYLTGRYALPQASAMEATIKAEEEYYMGSYYKSRRHTMQISFDRYCWDLAREEKAGAARAAAAGNALPVPARALSAHPMAAE